MAMDQLGARVIKRRLRVPLSCEQCRVRKLKCNREEPCQNCTARGRSEDCHYLKLGYSRSSNTTHGTCLAKDRTLRHRIDRLEEMVKNLLAEQPDMTRNGYSCNDGSSGLPSLADGTFSTASTPRTIMEGVHSVYLGSGDWSDVLVEINALKETWGDETLEDAPIHHTVSHTVDGSGLLTAQSGLSDKHDILSSLPRKIEVDILVAEFFDRDTFPIDVPPLIHQSTFMREYEEHWTNPCRTDFIWLGLLFSMLGITMLAYHQNGEPAGYEGCSESLYHLYRIRAAQCLQNGDIAKCLPYTVVTLRLNATAELNRGDDNRRGLWITMGVMLRAAINMGYHRDPAQMPGITVLQAEYRRRVWAAVIGLDNFIAFRGGFPPTMPAICANTREPGNFHEHDLSEDMERLPVSRPFSENTGCTYMILKLSLGNALSRVTGAVCAHFNDTAYDTVLDVDRALHEVYDDFPPYMKAPAEPDKTLPGRRLPPGFSHLGLARFFHRGVCTLHRRWMAKAARDDRFQLSRSRCVSSALCLLHLQQERSPTIYRTSETRQILMMGGMIILQELAIRRNAGTVSCTVSMGALLDTLEKSCTHLAQDMDSCPAARRLHDLLMQMLLRSRNDESDVNFQSLRLPIAEPGPPSLYDFEGSFALDEDWLDMNCDWSMWDVFVDVAGPGEQQK